MFWQNKNQNQDQDQEQLSLADYLTDGLLVFDSNNKLILANSQVEVFFEIEEEKLLGKSILELARFPDFKNLVSLLGGGIREVFRQELQVRENFVLEVTTVSIMQGHTRNKTLVVLHDVSREKLAQKMKTEFVTLAAHQLRTPISALKWCLEMLLEGDLGKLNSGQRKVLEKAHSTNDKAIRLINDLLNVAEIEEGRYLSNLSLSDIEDLIISVVKDFKDKMEEKKLNFEFIKPKDRLPKVMLDEEKMEIAVRNILDNAVRYTASAGKVSIFIIKKEKEIEVQIKDTGLGIPRAQQDKLFSKFFRASNILKVDTEGTGLGLYIAKNIIEAHGGVIWFDSREGKGSTFYFSLPVKKRFGQYLREEFY